MPSRRQPSAIAKRVKARLAIRRARNASPTDIAQYALYAAQQWRLRDVIFPFLTSLERVAFERLEMYHRDSDAVLTAVSPLPSLAPQPAERPGEETRQSRLTQARAQRARRSHSADCTATAIDRRKHALL